MSSPYQGALTCVTCQIVFETGDAHRVHYKTDWHRYNLKRKIINLLPVDRPTFESRILSQQIKENEENAKSSIYCTICRKSYNSQKSFDSHLSSKQHKTLALQSDNEHKDIGIPAAKKIVKPVENKPVEESDDEYEDVDDDEEWGEVVSENNPIVNNICLFCPQGSENLLQNIKHMSDVHSFFIPDVEYLVDMKGLLVYLGEKVCQGFMCLWCNDSGKNFHSIESAQAHMIDKGHTKMIHEGEALLEYSDFYDYSSSYPADTPVDDYRIIEDVTSQLILPSGARIGKRSLMRYYRQNLNPNHDWEAMKETKLNKVINHYRHIGWTGTFPAAAARKARDLKVMKQVQTKMYMQLGVKANKFQKHFRQQVNF
ncbi:cytoplasmic 60S subunit biogenesis factor ZNF622 [Metopolophium dirhodum]|uniref:cytoplasmic 60S subunit biogenesis factor ZNF622 n=1 Tax=Metopolophium dirhodum TaxID=44670 RepID=UPI00298FC022|nr:cytoplasmic 60S subunit biogenesis factor ZNF622 [Metopolophium dirhodum]XP_060865912.1 cytoplasmic 60S subunit biogenesis factor ZNF622 [Metopolophium dirhodum]